MIRAGWPFPVAEPDRFAIRRGFHFSSMLIPSEPPVLTENRRWFRRFVALYAALFLLLALGLGNRGLNEPDEGRYVNIAQNFLLPGAGLWEPVMSGFGHYDKPPLVYWSTALCLKLFGASEWAARLTPFLGACLTLLALGWAARRWYGREAAFWSVLICGTLGQFWLLARFLTPDMFMTGWCALGVAFWAECRHRSGHWGFWTLSLLCWSLAWWTKATPCLAPLAGLALGLKMRGDKDGWKALRPGLLLPGILVLGCAWYVVMMVRHPALKGFFFGRELMGRMTGHVSGRKGPVYYYLGVSILAWLPWWPLAVWAAWTDRWAGGRAGLRDLAAKLGPEGWIALTGLVIFSLISSKLPTYTLCLTPWVALLMTRAILRWKTRAGQAQFRGWMAALSVGIVLLYGAVVFVAPRYEAGFGANSSLRPLREALRGKAAAAVCFDRHWPGAEFYLGPNVYFITDDSIQQRSDDEGDAGVLKKAHFYTTKELRGFLTSSAPAPAWLVRYRRAKTSPFDSLVVESKPLERLEVGDFILWRLR